MNRLLRPLLAAAILGLAPGGFFGLLSPAAVCAEGLGDQEASAHLSEMERQGILADPVWANAYWARSRTAPTVAARVSDLRWALRFDPDLHSARRDLIGVLLRQRDPEFANQIAVLLERSAHSFPAQQWALLIALTLLGPAAIGGLALFALLAIGKSLPRIHHSLRERLHFLPAEVREGATLLTLFLPLVLALTLPPTAALFWVILLGTIGVWAILDRWERRFGVLAMVALLLAPWGLALWTRVAQPALPDSYLNCLWATQVSDDDASEAILLRIPPPGAAQDPDYHATLALLDRRAGRWDSAAQHLRQAIQLAPDRWAYHNNLGNVRLLAGRTRGALNAYGDALALAPNAALVRVNRAQAWVRQLEFNLADKDIREAGRLGYHFPRLQEANAERLVVRDRFLDSGDVWRRFAHGEGLGGTLTWSRAAMMSFTILLPMRPFWISLPLFLTILYVAQARTLYRTFPCATCGKIISRKSHFRVLRRSLCGECYSVREANRAPLRRAELLAERRRRMTRVPHALGMLMSAILPGTGHLLSGSPRQASMLLGMSATLLATAFGVAALAPTAGPLGDGHAPSGLWAGLAFGYVVLAAASVRRFRKVGSPATPGPERGALSRPEREGGA